MRHPGMASIGRWAARLAVGVALVILASCGGGDNPAAPGFTSIPANPAIPAAPTYTVGGIVSNLQVAGLTVTLTVSGTSTSFAVPPNINTFTFTTALPDSTTYSAVISNQPPGFTQQCSITNGTGTIASASVNNVLVLCRQAAGLVSTIAGTNANGYLDGTGTVAQFNYPHGLAVDAAGVMYVSDQGNSAMRKVAPNGVVSTLAGSPTTSGFANGTGTAALFSSQMGQAAVDVAGNIYVSDNGNNMIRKITPAGVVSTVVGSTTSGFADGPAASATLNFPHGVAVDGAGNVYVGDSCNNAVRKVTPGGTVTTLAANVTGSTCGGVYGLAVDAGGNVYVADRGENKILKITAAGVVSTLAGTGASGSGDGTATLATFSQPRSVAVDAFGNVFVADGGNNLIRKINPAGFVSTLAGGSTGGGFADGDGLSQALMAQPWGIATDAAGNVYFADEYNFRVRKIVPH